MGFVFIEANVKKWGLAPMTGSLAPPPPYGSEQGSILLETGRECAQPPQWRHTETGHARTRSGTVRTNPPSGPVRTPTDISLGPLPHIPTPHDIGEGTSRGNTQEEGGEADEDDDDSSTVRAPTAGSYGPPPVYTSPQSTPPENPNSNDTRLHPPIPTYDAAVRGTDRAQ